MIMDAIIFVTVSVLVSAPSSAAFIVVSDLGNYDGDVAGVPAAYELYPVYAVYDEDIAPRGDDESGPLTSADVAAAAAAAAAASDYGGSDANAPDPVSELWAGIMVTNLARHGRPADDGRRRRGPRGEYLRRARTPGGDDDARPAVPVTTDSGEPDTGTGRAEVVAADISVSVDSTGDVGYPPMRPRPVAETVADINGDGDDTNGDGDDANGDGDDANGDDASFMLR